MPYLTQTTELYWGIAKSDWIQIALATIALFGGSKIGSHSAMASRFRDEDRRSLLRVVETLMSAHDPLLTVMNGPSEPTSLDKLGRLEIANSVPSLADMGIIHSAFLEAIRLTDLLPFWERQTFVRFQRDARDELTLLLHLRSDPEEEHRGLTIETIEHLQASRGLPRQPSEHPQTSMYANLASRYVVTCASRHCRITTKSDQSLFDNWSRTDSPLGDLDGYLRRTLRTSPARRMKNVIYRIKLTIWYVSDWKDRAARWARTAVTG